MQDNKEKNTEINKEVNSAGKEEGKTTDNIKTLITETVTGRKMTPDRILRAAGAAAVCGAAFGLAAALTFCGINAVSKMAERNNGINGSETLSELDSSESGSGDNEQGEGGVASSGEGTDSDGTGTSTGNEGASETGTQAGVQTGTEAGIQTGTDQNQGGSVSAGGNNNGSGSNIDKKDDLSYLNAYDDVMKLRQSVVRETAKYIVSVSATSTGTTWFDSIASSTKTYAGVIISVGEDEILILTSAKAAASESLRVSFENSVTVDAYVKQRSEADDLAVLAVSAKNGIEESMLRDMESIEFANARNLKTGEPVIAVGAPLGIIGSYAFGDVSYINRDEAGFDVEQDVFYTDMNVSAENGTFVVDCEGRFLGVASPDSGSIVTNTGISRIISCSSLLGTINHLKQGKGIAYAGINGSAVNFDMRYSGIPDGVYVTDVKRDSAAYNAGIMRGDIISEIDEQEVLSMDALTRAIRKYAPGDTIDITARRSGSNGSYKTIHFKAVLRER